MFLLLFVSVKTNTCKTFQMDVHYGGKSSDKRHVQNERLTGSGLVVDLYILIISTKTTCNIYYVRALRGDGIVTFLNCVN